MVVFQACLLLPFSSLLLLHPLSPPLEGMGAAGATPARYRGGSTHPPPLPQWSDLGTSYFPQGALSASLTPAPFPSFAVVVQTLSRVRLFATPWTAAHQASLSISYVCCVVLSCSVVSDFLCDPMDSTPQALLSMGFSWQECWSGFPCPLPGDLPHPGMEPTSPAFPVLQVDSLPTPFKKNTIKI